eukprot:58026-Chlamydomonas_euryale.AAC.9
MSGSGRFLTCTCLSWTSALDIRRCSLTATHTPRLPTPPLSTHKTRSHAPRRHACRQTDRGKQQACEAGQRIRQYIEARSGTDYRLFCYLSPYKRSLQTFEGMACAFPAANILGVQEEVQLREQDFGNFQNLAGKQHEKAERLRFGRFFYRFPNGESGADVYDRITIFEDHVVREACCTWEGR